MAGEDTGRSESLCMRCARGSLNTYKPPRIPARILWPALGFPAVIAPGDSSKSDDASTCVTAVIVSKKKSISKKQAAEHLRFVAWDKRHTRYLPPGTANGFTENEIEVRSNPDSPGPPYDKQGILRYGSSDEFVQHLYFGYDVNLKNGFTAGLSSFVIKKYSEWGYPYLHEIRVSRAASSRLSEGKYNLFWINSESKDTENEISDEMALLIEKHAKPTRQSLLDALSDRLDDDGSRDDYLRNKQKLSDYLSFFLKEYEYDFDALHPPYNKGSQQQADAQRRTEVLHPLFVEKSVPHLQIGHITDLHVDVRSDVYEYNLTRAGANADLSPIDDGREVRDEDLKKKSAGVTPDFNNWNKSVVQLYTQAKQSCDVLLLTGDLIDYGRGHIGLPNSDKLGDDGSYHVDRNWFLFYYVLASGNSYEKPAYTILGNHDWRINPYTPFAIAGAPDARSLVNNYMDFKPQLHTGKETEEEWKDREKEAEEKLSERLNALLLRAHGPGADRAFTYLMEAKNTLEFARAQPEEFYKTLWALIQNAQTMNIEHAPTETRIESVAWYLLLINPFLDYAFHLPGGYDVLMLDWGEYENVLFPIVINGQEWDYMPWEAAAAAAPGPKARNSLTDLQKVLVQEFSAKPTIAKVLCIHAPPIGPYPAWTNAILYGGRVEHAKHENRAHYRTIYPDGTSRDWDAIYAIRPKDGPFGQEADYGSIENHREWLINELRRDDAHVRLVLSGHIHRNGLFVVYEGKSVLAGTLLTKLITPAIASGAAPPAVARELGGEHGPLYVNTTSAGPRGHLYSTQDFKPGTRKHVYVESGYSVIVLSQDGTIRKVEFRTAKGALAATASP